VLARTAVAAGADGLLVEVHPNPDKAWSDGDQSLDFDGFDDMMDDLEPWLSLRNGTRQLCGNHRLSPRPMEAVG
jgi:3-deoxy-D-arabino-heptulosonate 7-phosphate (DAHP) synthase